jgi:hypothetical protein
MLTTIASKYTKQICSVLLTLANEIHIEFSVLIFLKRRLYELCSFPS